MYSPSFVFSNKLIKLLCDIEGAKEVIASKESSPESLNEYKEDSLVQKIYYGTHIEGNELTLLQTKQTLEGASNIVQNLDVQEVINYKRTFNLLDELAANNHEYMVDWLRDIHSTLKYNVLSSEKTGHFRTTQVIIRDQETGEVIITPPPAIQLQSLLVAFFEWLNSSSSQELHPLVRAGIAHYVLNMIHPFVEGSSATVRMFTNLILLKEGYSAQKLLCLEEKIENAYDEYFEVFYGEHKDRSSLFDLDLTPIIEFFCSLVFAEFRDIRQRVSVIQDLSPTKFKVSEQVALSSRQMKLLQYISDNGRAVMKELKDVVTNVSDDTILRDLTALVKKGIIEKEGTTKASSYILKR